MIFFSNRSNTIPSSYDCLGVSQVAVLNCC